MAGKANPIFTREGMLSALWDRAYWLNEPSRTPSVVLSEILRAYNGLPQIRPSFLEEAIDETISAASKLLEVIPASVTTNHSVNTANKYLRALFYSDSMQM